MQTSTFSTATSIKMPGDLRDRIQHLAQARNRTPHSIMLQALEAYVTREEKREAFRQNLKVHAHSPVSCGWHAFTRIEAAQEHRRNSVTAGGMFA